MRAKRIDENQPEIVAALRRIGCSVAITSSAGDGFPDIVVGLQGKNFMLEIKDGNKSPSEQKLTPDQKEFHDAWRGQISIVKTIDEALEIVTKQER